MIWILSMLTYPTSFAELRQVVRPSGILACWTYHLWHPRFHALPRSHIS